MIRAVVDTNVFVSAFIQPRSPPGLVIAKLVEGNAFELILSTAILDELSRALRYPAVRKFIKVSDDELSVRLAMVDTLATVVDPKGAAVAVCRDPDDDKIIAAALEGGADFIVTGDDDLLELSHYEQVRIVTPREFLGLLG